MMRMMNNKKNVKIFSIVIAAIFIIGIGALAYTQMATPGTSAASNVGVIDMPAVVFFIADYMFPETRLPDVAHFNVAAKRFFDVAPAR